MVCFNPQQPAEAAAPDTSIIPESALSYKVFLWSFRRHYWHPIPINPETPSWLVELLDFAWLQEIPAMTVEVWETVRGDDRVRHRYAIQHKDDTKRLGTF